MTRKRERESYDKILFIGHVPCQARRPDIRLNPIQTESSAGKLVLALLSSCR
jgi:hypothetical protein